MSMMITVTKDEKDDFKTVIIVCYDRLSKKYRCLNYANRTIAPQVYNYPEEIVSSFQELKRKGRIKDFEVINNKTN